MLNRQHFIFCTGHLRHMIASSQKCDNCISKFYEVTQWQSRTHGISWTLVLPRATKLFLDYVCVGLLDEVMTRGKRKRKLLEKSSWNICGQKVWWARMSDTWVLLLKAPCFIMSVSFYCAMKCTLGSVTNVTHISCAIFGSGLFSHLSLFFVLYYKILKRDIFLLSCQ